MDELDLLSRLRPSDENPDPVALAKHRIALLNHAANPGARIATRRWAMPRLAIGAAVLAVITAVGLVIALPGGHQAPSGAFPPGPGTAPAAVVLLANAADAAANTPAGKGDWTYISTITVAYDDRTHTFRTQAWRRIDGGDSLIRDERDGKVTEFKNADISGMSPPSLRNPTYRYLTTLPTDPTALRKLIYAEAQNELGDEKGPNARQLYTVDQWAFQLIGRLVGGAPPTLKAALYRVAATVPGVVSVNDTTDAAGRHGIGVAHSDNNGGDRTTLIFDRTTYQFMGSASEIHDGRTAAEAVLATGLVEKAGQTP
ncbi:MAG TPA: CU044_5270 family protein [Kutzneria sp.]|nr:CU044_5270 family protein [Kutzneria sp.]